MGQDVANNEQQHSTGFRDLPERLVALIIAALKNDQGNVHAETAIATAAVLTGEYVLRFHVPDMSGLQPGSAILNDEVNQTLFEREDRLKISDVFFNALFAQGIDVGKNSWPDSIPDENQVMMNPLEVVARLRPQAEILFDTCQTERLERAYVSATATALLVSETRKVLDPNIGKALALEAILLGAKSVPIG